jgi:hypothetical protein
MIFRKGLKNHFNKNVLALCKSWGKLLKEYVILIITMMEVLRLNGREAWKRLKANLQREEDEVRMERQVTDWLDEAVQEFERNGGMKDVKGKGKPLQIETGDAIYGVLKTANVRPPWLELQHDIRDGLQRLSKGVQQGTAVRPEQTLQEINKKISKYNSIVPHYTMQKALVDFRSLEEQRKSWE